MKAVILATAMSAAYILSLTVVFRRRQSDTRRARLMVRFFLLSLPVAVGIYCLTPDDLGIIPRTLVANSVLEFFFFVFLYSSAFFGGSLQLYNLADRGFSLRITIDAAESPDGSTTVERILSGYSAGRGIAWMYQKRIDDLAALKLVEVRGDHAIVATDAGRRVASRFAWLRRFLKVTQTPQMVRE